MVPEMLYKYRLLGREIEENYCSEVKFNIDLPGLGELYKVEITEFTTIFYRYLNKRVVNICFIHHIRRIFSPYRIIKVPYFATVTASLRVIEIAKTSLTHLD